MSTDAKKIVTAVFEKNNILRDALHYLISTSARFECYRPQAFDGNFSHFLPAEVPDLIVMDLESPSISVMDASKRIKHKYEGAKVVILSSFEDGNEILQYLYAETSVGMVKIITPEQMVSSLYAEEMMLEARNATLSNRVIRFLKVYSQDNFEGLNITPKEKTILEYMVQGNSYKMIAAQMGISNETVKTHIKNIYRKLQVNSSTEAVAKAIKRHIISTSPDKAE
ncbi:MAG: response regulator transcription factor [Flavipsychrobacter sp.]|nr:response regulator transcription factor [Flavipsychrobacter sp.]